MNKSYIIEAVIFIIFAFLFGYFGIKTFNHTFDIGKTYTVTFHDIDSIVVGSPVRIMGVDVGNVKKIKNKFDEIEVTFVIYDSQIPVPAGTLATIEFFGLAGSRSIDLYPPHSDFEGIGFAVEEPIRINDAFSIMSKLGEALMSSVAGISDFAKGRSQAQFSDETNALLKSTVVTKNSLDVATGEIVALDNDIQNRFNKLDNFIENTTHLTQKLSTLPDLNSIDITLKFSKRNIVNLKRDLVQFDKNCNEYSKNALKLSNSINQRCANLQCNTQRINQSLLHFGNSLCQIDKVFCIDTLNRIESNVFKAKEFSQKLDNSF